MQMRRRKGRAPEMKHNKPDGLLKFARETGWLIAERKTLAVSSRFAYPIRPDDVRTGAAGESRVLLMHLRF